MPKEQPKEGSIRGSNRSTPLPGLRNARRRQGLTQRELAALAGIGAGTVSDLEVRRRGGYPATVKRLCRALGITPAQLMTVEHLSEQEQTHWRMVAGRPNRPPRTTSGNPRDTAAY